MDVASPAEPPLHAVAWPSSGTDALAPLPEHDELRDAVAQLVARRMPHQSLRTVAASAPGYSPALWSELCTELDVAAMALPEHLGGAGYGMRELGVVLEVTGGALLAEPVLSSAVLGAGALALAEDPDAVAVQRGAVLRGDVLATVGLGAAAALTATRTADGWAVTGTALRVLQGATAELLVVRAAVDGGDALLAVDVSGVDAVAHETLDLTRPQADLVLDAAPATLLVGPAGSAAAWRSLRTLVDAAVACEHAGMVAHLLTATTAHVVARHQFGRPIGSFQAVKHRLADVLVDLERARSAARYAAAACAGDPTGAALAAAVAAAVCTDAVIRTAHEAVQLHGGIGFTWEHPAHFYLRRALGDEGLFGDARAHRARVAGLVGL
ncbi:acyl-CoA dehydrogenase family protein [Rhodococcus aerolatus]